jgi:hypothetical protein
MAAYLILRSKRSSTVFYEKVTLLQRPIQIYLVLLKSCLRNRARPFSERLFSFSLS